MTEVARLAVTVQQARDQVTAEWLMSVAKGLAEEWSEGSFSGQAEILPLIRLIHERDPATAGALVEAVRAGLRGREIEDIDDAEFARDFMTTYEDAITDEDREILGELADSFASAEIESLLKLEDPAEIRERMTQLEGLAEDFGNSIALSDVRRIDNRIERIEYENDNYDDWDADRSGNYERPPSADENDAINDLFDTLDRD
jgi:hypothetical protein